MKNNIRILALVMALAACVGLFAACGSSQNGEESTASDVTTEDNAANSGNSSTADGENAAEDGNAPADEENTGAEEDSSAGGKEAEDELYVAEVTAVNDDGTLALTLCAPAEGVSGEISDYAKVTMADYVLSSATVNYAVPDDASVSLAENGELTESSADIIAAGDRLIVYSQDGGSYVVIYPAE